MLTRKYNKHGRDVGTAMRSQSRRRGAMNVSTLLALAFLLLAILIGLLILGSRNHRQNDSPQLLLYCAAGLRYPLEPVVEQYRKECGVDVRVQYGGSQSLLSQLEVSRTGDLFLAADDSYLAVAKSKGLVAETIPLAVMRPVLVISPAAKALPTSIAQLLELRWRIACGNPGAAAIGSVTRTFLEASGQWEAFEEQVTTTGVFKATVNDVANDVKLGSVDAGIVWDATAAQYPELRVVRVPELSEARSNVEIGVLESAKNPTAALHFARYVAACDRGLKQFAASHYEVVDGDIWEDVPRMTFFAGSVNRRALEQTLEAFRQREGIDLTTVYNGCGILTGQMRIAAAGEGGGFPDTYMACDVYYLDTVKDWFQEAVNVSDTDIVIAVQKGNPKDIRSLKDLTRPGIRVAVGQPDQCTIGALTRRLLEHEGLYEPVLNSNVVTQTATSALLVPTVTSKSADAALAYRTDTLAEQDKVDIITVDSDLSKAIQPYSIAKSSRHKELGRRLYQAIAKSRAAFESAGFHWRLEDSPTVPKQDQPSMQ